MKGHSVSLTWATPGGEALLVDIARISNPNAKPGIGSARLVSYLIRNQHWSPFEMVNMCMRFHTTRDIGRQMLRHWTLRPQEFSQRYADVRLLQPDPVLRECRMKVETNRQSSVESTDLELAAWWERSQIELWNHAMQIYGDAIGKGIANEVARVVLPEGMTPTVLEFNGNLRSWMHFCQLRMGHGTQKEATHLATEAYNLVGQQFPSIIEALEEFSS